LIDRAYFESSEWRNQANDGMGRGTAWLDLLALVNQKRASIEPRGLRITLERGQCGWSRKGLADRWGWSQGKVSAQLTAWEKTGRIKLETSNETTLITVINYDNYQTGLKLLSEQTASKPGADCEQTETEKGEGRREYKEGTQGEKGEGTGNVPPRLVTLEAALKYSQSHGDLGYTDDEVEAEWLYFDSRRGPNGEWLTERGQVWTDWQSALKLGLKRSMKKNTGGGGTANGVSANVMAIQTGSRVRELAGKIRALEDEVHQDRASNMPFDPKKMRQLQELRADLDAARPSEEEGKS
jgi:hypothetical protein